MLTDSKRKIREGARKGARARARALRATRRHRTGKVLRDGYARTVKEIAEASEQSVSVVRAALKEMDGVETFGNGMYRLSGRKS